MNLAHPAVQSVLVPLLAALVAAALLRGPARSGCVGVGLLAGLALIAGFDWPPRGGPDKLPWMVAGGLLVGLALDAARTRRDADVALAVTAIVAGLLWLAAPQLARADLVLLLELAAVIGAGALLAIRLPRVPGPPGVPAAMLGAAAAGAAMVAFNGGSLVIAQALGALAVAAGVLTAVTWVAPSAGFGAAALLAGVAAWVWLLGLAVLLTETSRWALALLPLAFLADVASRRLPAGRGRAGSVLASLWAALVAALPLAFAVWLSTALRTSSGLYYQ